MKSGIIFSFTAIMVMAIMIVSCSKSVNTLGDDPDPYDVLRKQLAQSPRDNEEAELMTLWLSGDIVAYSLDYNRVRDALNVLRQTYSDSIPQLDSIHFVYPDQESGIAVILSESATDELRVGSFVDWDSLNTLFQMETIDTSQLATSRQVDLTFKGRLNPSLLAHYYMQLDGVTGTGFYPRTVDYSNLYPWTLGDNHTFLLRKAWGNCENECQNNHFWYFRVSGSNAVFVGELLWSSGVSLPDWWDEASVALCRYSTALQTKFCYP